MCVCNKIVYRYNHWWAWLQADSSMEKLRDIDKLTDKISQYRSDNEHLRWGTIYFWIFRVFLGLYAKHNNIKNIQLNFVKANFIKTNNSLRRSESSVSNWILLILTKIHLFKSKYLCRTFYVSKHILRSRSGVFFIKSNG